jgi:hypothetical protein
MWVSRRMARASEPTITYTPRPGMSAEDETSVLSAVYRFILFECSASKKATGAGGRDDAKESQDVCTATQHCT